MSDGKFNKMRRISDFCFLETLNFNRTNKCIFTNNILANLYFPFKKTARNILKYKEKLIFVE